MDVYTYDLIDEYREILDTLNHPELSLIKYEISSTTDKELGLMVNVILYMQKRNDAMPEKTHRMRSLEFAANSSELRSITNEPQVKVIKIHQIRDFTHVAFVIDYYLE